MKKILYFAIAAAAVLSCTKTEVNYGESSLISIAPIAKVNTKAAVQGTYPTDLPLLVYANAGSGNTFTDVYLDDAVFTHNGSAFVNSTAFWPNVLQLKLTGCSQSGNVSVTNTGYTDGKLTVTGYNQPDTGNNDLMWFPLTGAQSATNSNLSVTMQHACAWIVFNFKGNDVTGSSTSPWKITKVVVKGVSKTGSVDLTSVAKWDNLTGVADYVAYDVYNPENPDAKVYDTKGLALSNTTTVQVTNSDNIVVIPQTATNLEITYEFKAPSGEIIKEVKENIALTSNIFTSWNAGKKYVYDITIGTQQIKIAPSVSGWSTDINGDGYTNDNTPVTVQ